MGIPFQRPLGGEPLSLGAATVFAEALCSVPYATALEIARIVPNKDMVKVFMSYLSGLTPYRRREGLPRIEAEASPG